jgi:O-antigen/teichoic acid export membrane protein
MGALVKTAPVSWAEQGFLQRSRAWWSAATTTRQGVHSLLDQGVVSATNFLTGVIVARACSKAELGLYMLGFSLFLFLIDAQTSLIATPYMIYAPRVKGSEKALYTGSTLIHQLALSLLATVALVGGAVVVTAGVGPPGLGPVLWALVAVVSAIMFREHSRRVYFASLEANRALIFDICIAVVQIGSLLILARLHLLSANRAYWVVGCACGIAVLGWLWSERSAYRVNLGQSLADLKKNWAFGRWALGSGFVWTVSMNIYPWLLAAFHGTASAGVWAACLGAVALANPAVLGVQNFLGPKIAHVYALEGSAGLRRFVFKATLISAVLVSVFCLAMTLRGGPLVALLYGHGYLGNGLIVGLLAWNLSISAVASAFSRALFAIERADVDFAVNVIGLFMMLTFGLWLVRSYSVVGAALGLLLANAAMSIARGVCLHILIRQQTRREFV